MRDEAVDGVGEVGLGATIVEDCISKRGGADVLHAAEDEVGDNYLGVLRVRVGDADALGEEAHHLGRATERASAFGRSALRHVVLKHDAVHPFLDLVEVARGDAEQVRDVRLILPPAERALPAPLDDAHELAVRDGGERLRHRDDNLAGGHLVREVDAREPVARVFVLPLAPDLDRLLWVAVIRADEIEAAPGAGGVVDDGGDPLARLAPRAQVNAQAIAVVGVLGLGAPARDRNGGDLHLDGVELHVAHTVVDRRERRADDAIDALALRVDLDLQPDVAYVHHAVAGVVGRIAGHREGPLGPVRRPKHAAAVVEDAVGHRRTSLNPVRIGTDTASRLVPDASTTSIARWWRWGKAGPTACPPPGARC